MKRTMMNEMSGTATTTAMITMNTVDPTNPSSSPGVEEEDPMQETEQAISSDLAIKKTTFKTSLSLLFKALSLHASF